MAKGKTVFMFSGQGDQFPGMGREIYESSPAARAVFDIAEKVRPGTIEQIFSGSEAELAKTENTQPCVFCVDLAAAAALKEAGISADMLAGFSLGEIAALAFSGAVTYEDGFILVCKRAELMKKASESIDAGMVAVLKMSDEDVTEICREFEKVFPVNFNCEGQVVVAGLCEEIEPFVNRVKAAGGRAVPLKVGGPFHSPYMSGAADAFAEVLSTFEIDSAGIPLYSNVTAEPYDGIGSEMKKLLAAQICSAVLWRKTVENMLLAGADTFIEAGPGKTLCGLVSRISKNTRLLSYAEAIKEITE